MYPPAQTYDLRTIPFLNEVSRQAFGFTYSSHLPANSMLMTTLQVRCRDGNILYDRLSYRAPPPWHTRTHTR
jgi:hypothetical protein